MQLKKTWSINDTGHTAEHNEIASRLCNVKDFGAVGLYNGTTHTEDDSAAIQAAINASNVVYLPTGNYGVHQPLIARDGIKLFGDGVGNTVINGSALSGSLLTGYFTDIDIGNITWIGGSSHIFEPTALRYCYIHACHFESCGGDAIHSDSEINYSIVIDRCQFGGVGTISGNGVYARGSYDQCTFRDNTMTSIGGDAIHLEGTLTYALISPRIINNKIEGNVGHGVYMLDTIEAVIDGNTFEGNQIADVVLDTVHWAGSMRVTGNAFASSPYHVRVIDAACVNISDNWFNWNGVFPSPGNKLYSISVESLSQKGMIGINHNMNTLYPLLNDGSEGKLIIL